MRLSRKIVSILLVSAFIAGSLLVMFPTGGLGENSTGAPERGVLYKHTESHNLTFSKPTFYGDKDPNNNNKYVGNNTWDDIAFVIFFQDQHTSTKKVGSNTVTVADIYQATFVNLTGKSKTTGTAQTILMEDFTATWCGYCASILGAMDRLDHDKNWWPDKYIGVEYHISGTYGNSIGGTRKSYYCASSGIPTWVIDGMDATIGGGTSPNSTATDNSIKSKINARITPSAFNITAKAGHTSTQAWVDFSLTIEDSNFDNKLVDCRVVMIQHAYPRRHGTNSACYLGWIAQSMQSPAIFQGVSGSNPVISNVVPAEGSVLNGTVDISFTATDADAADSKIHTIVEVKATGGADWTKLTKSGGVYKWNTAAKSGDNYLYPDGDYEIRIRAVDYWNEETVQTIGVSVLNPDPPTIHLNDQMMKDELDDGAVEGEINIYWMANDDEDGSDVTIDLFYMRPGLEWTPIAEGIENTGVYAWDTFNPRVPDNDRYRIMARVTDSDSMTADIATSFEFEINNPDAPTVEIQAPREGQELSGQPTIRWAAEDDEDSQSKLSIDISISTDSGGTYTPLATGIPSTGSYKFDTTYYDDAPNYRVMVKVTDTTGRSAEAESGNFSIYNNDAPGCRIIHPSEEDTVSGTVTIEWSSNDQEDAPANMTYDLYYMFSGETYWKELVIGEQDTGSFDLDTLELEEGDGVYTIKLVIKDSRSELSPASTVYFTVYNPDAPEIVSAAGPTTKVAKVASYTWYAEDPDPAETDGIKVWFYYSTDGVDWTAAAEGIPNTGSYTMDVSGLDDGTYKVKMVVADCQPDDFNRTSEYMFPDLIVDNNDPPEIEMVSSPDPSVEHNGTVTFSWSASDPEDDTLFYTIYYRLVDDSGWSVVPGAMRISSSSFTWDISTVPDGDYELKVVAVEDTRDSFEAEVITPSFTIKAPVTNNGDDDSHTQGTTSVNPQGSSDNTGLILGITIGIVILVLLVLVILALIILNRRKAAAAQLPPPGGYAMPPGLMPAGSPGLPGSISSGQLPAVQQPQQELPPAPASSGPGQELSQPVQPDGQAPAQEQTPVPSQEASGTPDASQGPDPAATTSQDMQQPTTPPAA